MWTFFICTYSNVNTCQHKERKYGILCVLQEKAPIIMHYLWEKKNFRQLEYSLEITKEHSTKHKKWCSRGKYILNKKLKKWEIIRIKPPKKLGATMTRLINHLLFHFGVWLVLKSVWSNRWVYSYKFSLDIQSPYDFALLMLCLAFGRSFLSL